MFRYFENLIDPYCDYAQADTPSTKLWPFFRDYCRPFYGVLVLILVIKISIAGMEVGIIHSVGWFVDVIQTTPKIIVDYAVSELIFLAFYCLLVHPVLFGCDVLFFNQTLGVNVATLVRWRAHRQVIQQPVGHFENDFAGRIANRMMQTPTSVSTVI
jgi:ATP-binding cassette subfamily B multidrug efflux pump